MVEKKDGVPEQGKPAFLCGCCRFDGETEQQVLNGQQRHEEKAGCYLARKQRLSADSPGSITSSSTHAAEEERKRGRGGGREGRGGRQRLTGTDHIQQHPRCP